MAVDTWHTHVCIPCSNIIVFCIAISTIILDYVYIHNAFRNDLQSIITSCEEDKFAIGDLEQWKEILDLHSRVEDEIIVVALQARLKQKKDSNHDDIPEELLSGNGHDTVKQLISKSLECSDNLERMKLLKELAVELDNHLKIEEETMIHLLIENFTKRELWALDSFIVVRVLISDCILHSLYLCTKSYYYSDYVFMCRIPNLDIVIRILLSK